MEHKTVRVDDAIWMDGARLGNGIGAWVRIEGHIMRWGFSRNGEEISGGTAELDLGTGSYDEWVEAPDGWLSRGTCKRRGLTS